MAGKEIVLDPDKLCGETSQHTSNGLIVYMICRGLAMQD